MPSGMRLRSGPDRSGHHALSRSHGAVAHIVVATALSGWRNMPPPFAHLLTDSAADELA